MREKEVKLVQVDWITVYLYYGLKELEVVSLDISPKRTRGTLFKVLA
jgi:hypothetical protein